MKQSKGLILAGMLFIAGCSSQSSSTGSSAANTKTAAADSAGVCKINARAVCQAMRNTPLTDSRTGMTTDRTYREQNSQGETATEYVRYALPSGNPIMLECYVNTHNSAVVYAKSSVGKQLSPADADFLRSQGLCAQ